MTIEIVDLGAHARVVVIVIDAVISIRLVSVALILDSPRRAVVLILLVRIAYVQNTSDGGGMHGGRGDDDGLVCRVLVLASPKLRNRTHLTIQTNTPTATPSINPLTNLSCLLHGSKQPSNLSNRTSHASAP